MFDEIHVWEATLPSGEEGTSFRDEPVTDLGQSRKRFLCILVGRCRGIHWCHLCRCHHCDRAGWHSRRCLQSRYTQLTGRSMNEDAIEIASTPIIYKTPGRRHRSSWHKSRTLFSSYLARHYILNLLAGRMLTSFAVGSHPSGVTDAEVVIRSTGCTVSVKARLARTSIGCER